jgi:hypothetical protein
MEETQSPMSSKDAGSVTASFLKAQRAHGESPAPVVNLKTNQDDFLSELDALSNSNSRGQLGCTVGRITNSLDEPIRTKFKEALVNPNVNSARLVELLAKYDITVGSDVMRRHRRALNGKDGCKCPRES